MYRKRIVLKVWTWMHFLYALMGLSIITELNLSCYLWLLYIFYTFRLHITREILFKILLELLLQYQFSCMVLINDQRFLSPILLKYKIIYFVTNNLSYSIKSLFLNKMYPIIIQTRPAQIVKVYFLLETRFLTDF